jgi:hypothetical protein
VTLVEQVLRRLGSPDLSDLRQLLGAAGVHDIEQATESLGLIQARGYHRNRDLLVLLQQLREDLGS